MEYMCIRTHVKHTVYIICVYLILSIDSIKYYLILDITLFLH